MKTISVPGCADKSRKFFDGMIAFAQSVGAKGLGYISWLNGEVKSPIAKFLSDDEIAALKELGNVENGGTMFFIADKLKGGSEHRWACAHRTRGAARLARKRRLPLLLDRRLPDVRARR